MGKVTTCRLSLAGNLDHASARPAVCALILRARLILSVRASFTVSPRHTPHMYVAASRITEI